MAQTQQNNQEPKQPNPQHRSTSIGDGMARQSGSQSDDTSERQLNNQAWDREDREEDEDMSTASTDTDSDNSRSRSIDASGDSEREFNPGRNEGANPGAVPSEFGSHNREEEDLNQMGDNESEIERHGSPDNMPNTSKERSGGMQNSGKESIV